MTTTHTTDISSAARQLVTKLAAATPEQVRGLVLPHRVTDIKAAAVELSTISGSSIPTGNAPKAEWVDRFVAFIAAHPAHVLASTEPEPQPEPEPVDEPSAEAVQAAADAIAHGVLTSLRDTVGSMGSTDDAPALARALAGFDADQLAGEFRIGELRTMAKIMGTSGKGTGARGRTQVARRIELAVAAYLQQAAVEVTTSAELAEQRKAAGEHVLKGQALRRQGTARSTGTHWQTWDGQHADTPAEIRALSEASGERWVCWCATHGHGRTFARYSATKSNRSHPELWCPVCKASHR